MEEDFEEMIKLAKRDNNRVRPYLVINTYQGKHLPIEPHKAINTFNALADKVYKQYSNDKLLIIGFAETATAIGATIACYGNRETYYIQTTRELNKDSEFMHFTEDHSHATEQMLSITGLEEILKSIDTVVFAEDEVTTGNTIMNIIKVMIKQYKDINLKFGIASLVNGMSNSKIEQLNNNGIECIYLLKSNHDNYTTIVNKYLCNGNMYPVQESDLQNQIIINNISDYINSRIITKSKIYYNKCKKLAENIFKSFSSFKNLKVLVLGTEEFMYPGLITASIIEKKANPSKVLFHATTRSPILVSKIEEYPLHERYELKSLYDNKRTTYIYNLDTYDRVIIITDALISDAQGINSLINALTKAGNKDINIFKWGD